MKESLKIFSNSINKCQILIGVAVLLIGTLVYLIDRPPDQIYFINHSEVNISLYNIFPNLFGSIGSSLPAFIHVFSFILITAGLAYCNKRGYLIICLSWFVVACAFELGQKFNSLVVKIIPHCFSGIPYLDNTKNYFLHGTFDYFDMTAITIGTIMAYFVLLTTRKWGMKNEKRI
jgi:hypothetical protein